MRSRHTKSSVGGGESSNRGGIFEDKNKSAGALSSSRFCRPKLGWWKARDRGVHDNRGLSKRIGEGWKASEEGFPFSISEMVPCQVQWRQVSFVKERLYTASSGALGTYFIVFNEEEEGGLHAETTTASYPRLPPSLANLFLRCHKSGIYCPAWPPLLSSLRLRSFASSIFLGASI